MISDNHVKWEEYQPIVKNLFSLGTFVVVLRSKSANQYFIVFRKITFENFYQGKRLSRYLGYSLEFEKEFRIYILASDLFRKRP